MVSESSLRTAADTISSGLFASLAEKTKISYPPRLGPRSCCIVVFVLLEGLVDSPQSPCLSAKPVTRNRKVPGSTPPRIPWTYSAETTATAHRISQFSLPEPSGFAVAECGGGKGAGGGRQEGTGGG